MMLIQALLIATWVVIAFIDEETLQFQLMRPIVTGPIVGLILGDLGTGLAVGAAIELMFIGVVFVGTAVPPDACIAASVATAFAVYTKTGVETAVALALPIAMIGQVISTIKYTVVNVAFHKWTDREASKGNSRGVLFSLLLPPLANIVLYGIPVFLAVYFGSDYI